MTFYPEIHAPDPRTAGAVERYHTWPTLQRQTDADHCWHVARILLALWPDAPRHVLVHALVHDVGEVVGDVPYATKRAYPDVKRALDFAELDAHLAMCIPWGVPRPQELTEQEHVVFKICDMLELWEFAMREIELGNRHAEVVRQRGLAGASVSLNSVEMPTDVVRNFSLYTTRRYGEHERTMGNSTFKL